MTEYWRTMTDNDDSCDDNRYAAVSGAADVTTEQA